MSLRGPLNVLLWWDSGIVMGFHNSYFFEGPMKDSLMLHSRIRYEEFVSQIYQLMGVCSYHYQLKLTLLYPTYCGSEHVCVLMIIKSDEDMNKMYSLQELYSRMFTVQVHVEKIKMVESMSTTRIQETVQIAPVMQHSHYQSLDLNSLYARKADQFQTSSVPPGFPESRRANDAGVCRHNGDDRHGLGDPVYSDAVTVHTNEERQSGHTNEERQSGHTNEERQSGHTNEERQSGHTNEEGQSGHIRPVEMNTNRLTSDIKEIGQDSGWEDKYSDYNGIQKSKGMDMWSLANNEVCLGKKFVDKEEAVLAAHLFSLDVGREFHVVTCKEKVWEARCVAARSANCLWRMRVISRDKLGVWEFTKDIYPHTCPRNTSDDVYRNLSVRLIAKTILPVIRYNPKVKCSGIRFHVNELLKAQPTHNKGSKSATKEMHSNWPTSVTVASCAPIQKQVSVTSATGTNILDRGNIQVSTAERDHSTLASLDKLYEPIDSSPEEDEDQI